MRRLLLVLLLIAAPACGTVESDRTRDGATDGPPRLDAGDGSTARDARSDADAAPPRDGRADALRDGGFAGCDAGQPGVQCIAAAGPTFVNGALAIDDANVYWAESGQTPALSAVMRVSRRGGAPVTLAHGDARVLASDGSYLYWYGYGYGDSTQFEVLRVPVDGGAVSTLAVLPPGSSPECLAVDDANVYWTDSWPTDAGGPGVLKIAKAGGTPVTVASASPMIGTAIAVDSTSVYWTAGELLRTGKDGGSVSTLAVADASGGGGYSDPCRSLPVVDGTLFGTLFRTVGTQSTGELVGISLADGSVRVLPSDALGPDLLVADARGVYWYTRGAPITINKTPLDGGPPVTLATPPTNSLGDLVLGSDGTLYWTTDTQVQALKPSP